MGNKFTTVEMASAAAPAAAAASEVASAASEDGEETELSRWVKNEIKKEEKKRFFDSLIRNCINNKSESESFESEINEYFGSEIKFRIFMIILVIYTNKAKEIFNYIKKQTDRVWESSRTMNCYKISYKKEETNHFNIKLLIQILNIIFGEDYKIFNYKWSDTRFYFEIYKEKKWKNEIKIQEKSGYFRIPNNEELTINNLRGSDFVGKPNRIDLPKWNCAFVTPEGTKIEGKDNIKTHLQTYNYDPKEHWICIIRKSVWQEIRGKKIWQKGDDAPVIFRNDTFLTISETTNGERRMRLKGEDPFCRKRKNRQRVINFFDAPINLKSLHSNTSSQKKNESRKHDELSRKATLYTETTNKLKKEQKEFEEKQRSERWKFDHKQRIEKEEFFNKQREEQKRFSTKQALAKS